MSLGAVMAENPGFRTDAQDARIAEIISELYDRQQRGESLSEEEILRAYPDLASDLRRYLAVIGEVRPGGDAVRGWAATQACRKDTAHRALTVWGAA